MKRNIAFIILILSITLVDAQRTNFDKFRNRVETFSMWGSFTRNYEDKVFGLNGKISYQIEDFMALTTQLTFTHKDGYLGYMELRHESGMYFSLTPNKRLCPILFAGVSKGAWKRNWMEPESIHFDRIVIDTSFSFGLGATYTIHRFRIFAEHKILSDVWQSNTNIGVQLRLFKPITTGRTVNKRGN